MEEKRAYVLYKILNLPPKSSIAQIRAQYKKLAVLLHPDKNSDSDKEAFEAKFIRLKEAYSTLSHPEKKRKYDETGHLENSEEVDSFWQAYKFFKQKFKKIDK